MFGSYKVFLRLIASTLILVFVTQEVAWAAPKDNSTLVKPAFLSEKGREIFLDSALEALERAGGDAGALREAMLQVGSEKSGARLALSGAEGLAAEELTDSDAGQDEKIKLSERLAKYSVNMMFTIPFTILILSPTVLLATLLFFNSYPTSRESLIGFFSQFGFSRVADLVTFEEVVVFSIASFSFIILQFHQLISFTKTKERLEEIARVTIQEDRKHIPWNFMVLPMGTSISGAYVLWQIMDRFIYLVPSFIPFLLTPVLGTVMALSSIIWYKEKQIQKKMKFILEEIDPAKPIPDVSEDISDTLDEIHWPATLDDIPDEGLEIHLVSHKNGIPVKLVCVSGENICSFRVYIGDGKGGFNFTGYVNAQYIKKNTPSPEMSIYAFGPYAFGPYERILPIKSRYENKGYTTTVVAGITLFANKYGFLLTNEGTRSVRLIDAYRKNFGDEFRIMGWDGNPLNDFKPFNGSVDELHSGRTDEYAHHIQVRGSKFPYKPDSRVKLEKVVSAPGARLALQGRNGIEELGSFEEIVDKVVSLAKKDSEGNQPSTHLIIFEGTLLSAKDEGVDLAGALKGRLLNIGLENETATDQLKPKNLVTELTPLGFDMVGLDPAVTESLVRGESPVSGHSYNGKAENMPFENGTFDMIFVPGLFDQAYLLVLVNQSRLGYDSIEAFYEASAREMRRVLRLDGIAAVNLNASSSEVKNSFQEIFQKAGFTVQVLDERVGLYLMTKKNPPPGASVASPELVEGARLAATDSGGGDYAEQPGSWEAKEKYIKDLVEALQEFTDEEITSLWGNFDSAASVLDFFQSLLAIHGHTELSPDLFQIFHKMNEEEMLELARLAVSLEIALRPLRERGLTVEIGAISPTCNFAELLVAQDGRIPYGDPVNEKGGEGIGNKAGNKVLFYSRAATEDKLIPSESLVGEASIAEIVFSPTESQIYIRSQNTFDGQDFDNAKLFNFERDPDRPVILSATMREGATQGAVFSEDGRYLFVPYQDGSADLFDGLSSGYGTDQNDYLGTRNGHRVASATSEGRLMTSAVFLREPVNKLRVRFQDGDSEVFDLKMILMDEFAQRTNRDRSDNPDSGARLAQADTLPKVMQGVDVAQSNAGFYADPGNAGFLAEVGRVKGLRGVGVALMDGATQRAFVLDPSPEQMARDFLKVIHSLDLSTQHRFTFAISENLATRVDNLDNLQALLNRLFADLPIEITLERKSLSEIKSQRRENHKLIVVGAESDRSAIEAHEHLDGNGLFVMADDNPNLLIAMLAAIQLQLSYTARQDLEGVYDPSPLETMVFPDLTQEARQEMHTYEGKASLIFRNAARAVQAFDFTQRFLGLLETAAKA